MSNIERNSWRRIATVASICLAASLLATGCGTSGGMTGPAKPTPPQRLEDRWGIQVASLRMSAAGRLIDFRYRVIDPDKAALLGDRSVKPILIDQSSGRKLAVPTSPKIGSLRQTPVKLTTGRIYFTLFSNSEQLIKSGSKVTVVIGEFRAENLTVE